MTFMDAFDFPGYGFLGHLFPALGIYALGLYYSFKGLYLIYPVPHSYGSIKKKRRKRKEAISMMLCGAVYAAFHLVHIIGTLASSGGHHHHHHDSIARNISYGIMGLDVVLMGAIKFMISQGWVSEISFDFSTLIGFSAVSLGIFFHGEDSPFNVIHYTFGVFLFLAGVIDVLKQIVGRKLMLLSGTLLISSAALLTVASDEVVHWCTRKGFHLGLGPLVVFCVLFSGAHIVALAWLARRVDPYAFDDTNENFSSTPLTAYISNGGGGEKRSRPRFTIGSDGDDDHVDSRETI